MDPQKLFTKISYQLKKEQLKDYNTFVALDRITQEPPGNNFLVHYNHYSGLTIVATDATETQMLTWADWHDRVSSVDYSQSPPSAYKRDEKRKIEVEPLVFREPREPKEKKSGNPGRRGIVDISQIQSMLKDGVPNRDIAKYFDISTAAVSYHKKKMTLKG
jgi:hypothetical protein